MRLMRFILPLVAVLALAGRAVAATITLTGRQRAPVDGGTAWVQANESGSTAPFQITNSDGKADFEITESQINQTKVGAYPSLYVGCHFSLKNCTTNNPFPLQVSAIRPGQVTTSVQSSTPASATGKFVGFYDIFFNKQWPPTTWGRSGGLELEIWLRAQNRGPGGGTLVASNVTIDGTVYNIYRQVSNDIIAFLPVSPNPTVQTFSGDLYPFMQYALTYGALQSGWYLIDMECGFEVNSGNVLGLGDSGFTVMGRGG